MSLSAYLWGIRLFTLLAFSAWVGIIFAVDPEHAGTTGIGLFFVSLLATLSGFMTLLVTWMYRKGLGEMGAAHHLGGAFRQAFLLATYVVGLVFFQYERILTWWDSLLFLAAILMIEFSVRYFCKREV